MTEGEGSERGSAAATWLNVRDVANLRVSSEDYTHRIDHALAADTGLFWRAAQPGEQVIEVRFRAPHDLTRIRLVFVEEEIVRTQQVTIRWSSHRGETHGEVVRQQFNFSPSGATKEIEDYRVELRAIESLQILVRPDISDGPALATLARLQLA